MRIPRRFDSSLGIVVILLLVSALSSLSGCSPPQVDPAAINYSGDPVEDFTVALRKGDLITLERLIDAEPSLLDLQDESGQNAMHYAAMSNQPGVIRLLRDKGMDPNGRDFEGRTPLTVLEDSGLRYVDARQMLLDIGGTG